MKNKLLWWQIVGLVINLVGAVFLVMCIVTDISDSVFLPISLCCITVSNGLQLFFNVRNRKK